ncbi:unnamed protein product [Dovyalis caffra]|uniref:ABC transmembrane type-1 domain-containing protein n=1 Tax=Dovyalis caffra TaxID=77055 RepID=A0AAV1S644_9ROSI|nr:unnamed protein product [Dovyalis caffra]
MAELSSESKKDGQILSKCEVNQKSSRTRSGSLLTVLKQSDWKDVLLMALGSMGSVADGSTMALIMIILSDLMNSYGSGSVSIEDVNKYALSLTYVAVGVASGSFLVGFCWARMAERKTFRLRRQYLKAVLRQDAGFFDTNQGESRTSQIVSNISIDTVTKQGVLTEKTANFISNLTTFITGQLAALYLSCRLATVAIPALLMLIIPGLVYGKLLGEVRKMMQEAYEVAGGIVEQAVSSLGIKQGLMKGMAIGTIGITYAVCALQGCALGASLMNVKYFIEANTAAYRIFDMIYRVPEIDP